MIVLCRNPHENHVKSLLTKIVNMWKRVVSWGKIQTLRENLAPFSQREKQDSGNLLPSTFGISQGNGKANLIDISYLPIYNQSMETDLEPIQRVLLEDAVERDRVTARRKLLADVLSRERYLTREDLVARVEAVLGKGCFGDAAWEDVFFRDMRVVKDAFRAAGHEVAYSRKKGQSGYYLEGEGEISQRVEQQIKGAVEEIDPEQIAVTRRLSAAERVQQGFSITHLAHQVTHYREQQREADHG
ncbi:MAG: hypothetical protein R6U51_06430 [Anaerolineales bacterium]